MKEVLQKNCGILYDPMGKPDIFQMSQDIPIVHPIIKYSWEHFLMHADFIDRKERVVEKHKRFYRGNEKIQFDDVVGLVTNLTIQLV